MYTREEYGELVNSLLEDTDGTRADDYAVLTSEINESLDTIEKQILRIDELEQKNGALKRENFKLFSRVGEKKQDPVFSPSQNNGEDDTDYIGCLVDENGNWK